jgi:Arylsulfotransferase (ASST)
MGHSRLSAVSLALAGTLSCADAGRETIGDSQTCDFVVRVNEISPKVPTVGIVEWSLVGATPISAKVVFEMNDAPSSILNRGGEAPVDLSKPNNRTLLLGLKPMNDYTFHIEATSSRGTCRSSNYPLPPTGSFATLPAISVRVVQADKREPGFIVTSSGTSVPGSAFIIDADGDVVWYFEAPGSTTRALMDYEGQNMWMLALNLLNSGGEMRVVSMDGLSQELDVPGLETAHHDFTIMPGGRIAALAWSEPGIDPESELLVRSPDGTITRPFRIGSNLFSSDVFHANAIHYFERDDSFTISDLIPNVLIKVTAEGLPQWQLGGTCENASAGARCSSATWELNHGHHLLEDGTFLFFNNTNTPRSHVLEFELQSSADSFRANLRKDYEGFAYTSNLGDVQRLPGGNTLVTFSGEGKIAELDSAWNEVQTFSVRVGYTSFRPSLYGPPPRL